MRGRTFGLVTRRSWDDPNAQWSKNKKEGDEKHKGAKGANKGNKEHRYKKKVFGHVVPLVPVSENTCPWTKWVNTVPETVLKTNRGDFRKRQKRIPNKFVVNTTEVDQATSKMLNRWLQRSCLGIRFSFCILYMYFDFDRCLIVSVPVCNSFPPRSVLSFAEEAGEDETSCLYLIKSFFSGFFFWMPMMYFDCSARLRMADSGAQASVQSRANEAKKFRQRGKAGKIEGRSFNK